MEIFGQFWILVIYMSKFWFLEILIVLADFGDQFWIFVIFIQIWFLEIFGQFWILVIFMSKLWFLEILIFQFIFFRIVS